jgi:hypothetical protein
VRGSLMRRVLVATMANLLPIVVLAQGEREERGHTTEAALSTVAPIVITINPEARVSVKLGGALPAPVPCGKPADLSVKIVNQGFVTSRLEAEFAGGDPDGAQLQFHPEPLRGVPEEVRQLQIILTNPGVTDLTIVFRAHNHTADLGGRNRVHFLMRCIPVP